MYVGVGGDGSICDTRRETQIRRVIVGSRTFGRSCSRAEPRSLPVDTAMHLAREADPVLSVIYVDFALSATPWSLRSLLNCFKRLFLSLSERRIINRLL